MNKLSKTKLKVVIIVALTSGLYSCIQKSDASKSISSIIQETNGINDSIPYEIEEIKDSTVMFFIPDSIQFNLIAQSDHSEGIYEVSSDFGFYANNIIELYKDSSLNVNLSDKRYFMVHNKIIDKMEQKSPFGVIFVNNEKFKIETGVFTDIDLQQMIEEFYK